MYVLGIDGGGTKTTGIVADENGNVYMEAIVGRSNPNTLSQEAFELVISELISLLRNQNEAVFNKIEVCFAGMAGVGESGRDKLVTKLLTSLLPSNPQVFVHNDAVNALYSGTLGDPGIVQIAGTGAITIGMSESREMVRVGGWGYLFDDEGSGFNLGNEALRAVFKSYDGRGPATELTKEFLRYFDVSVVPDLIEKIYGLEHPRTVIAPLSRIVIELSAQNDAVAKQIFETSCHQMAESIKACHNKLFETDETVTVVLSGGVFTNASLFIDQFEKLLHSSHSNLNFSQTLISPVGGAIVAGLKAVNVELSQQFVEIFNKEANL